MGFVSSPDFKYPPCFKNLKSMIPVILTTPTVFMNYIQWSAEEDPDNVLKNPLTDCTPDSKMFPELNEPI